MQIYANRTWNVTCHLRTATDKSGSSPSMTLTTVAKLQKRYWQESLNICLYLFPLSCFIKHQLTFFLSRRCMFLFYFKRSNSMAWLYPLSYDITESIIAVVPYLRFRTCPAWCTLSTMWWMHLSITRATTRARRCVSSWALLQRTDPAEETQVRSKLKDSFIHVYSYMLMHGLLVVNIAGVGWRHYDRSGHFLCLISSEREQGRCHQEEGRSADKRHSAHIRSVHTQSLYTHIKYFLQRN